MEQSLAHIFELQRSLMTHYILIEGLPEPPVELNTKEAKNLIKDLSFRVIDEMSEAFFSLELLYQDFNENNTTGAKTTLKIVNEEFADIWHYIIEICIYTRIDHHTMITLMKEALESRGHMAYESVYPSEAVYMDAMYRMGDYANREAGIYDLLPKQAEFRLYLSHYEDELKGGNFLSLEKMDILSSMLWHTTHALMKCQHALRHKPWAQSETQANVQVFYDEFGKFLLIFMQVMALVGKDAGSIYKSYILKNEINLNRIKDKY